MEQRNVTGLVFDLPDAAWTTEIRRLRAAYDRDRVGFPVEITVAGSSGLGWFSSAHSAEFIVDELEKIAMKSRPFQCAFAGIELFPASQVYYLALKDEKPFHAFQRSLAASELRFKPTPFAYKPHCTIVRLPAEAATALADLADFPVPQASVTISSVGLYSVDLFKNECRFVKRIPLGA
jgi:2'-5' RNA ligase